MLSFSMLFAFFWLYFSCFTMDFSNFYYSFVFDSFYSSPFLLHFFLSESSLCPFFHKKLSCLPRVFSLFIHFLLLFSYFCRAMFFMIALRRRDFVGSKKAAIRWKKWNFREIILETEIWFTRLSSYRLVLMKSWILCSVMMWPGAMNAFFVNINSLIFHTLTAVNKNFGECYVKVFRCFAKPNWVWLVNLFWGHVALLENIFVQANGTIVIWSNITSYVNV